MSVVTEAQHVKLPVWKSIVETCRLTARQFGLLLSFAWPWLLLLAGTSGSFYWTYYPLDEKIFEASGIQIVGSMYLT